MELSNIKVTIDAVLRDAIKTIDRGGIGIVFIVDINEFVKGVITDGDFRRAVLGGVTLDTKVEEVMNKDFLSVEQDTDEKVIINNFLSRRVNWLPVIDNGKLVDVFHSKDYNLDGKVILPESSLEIPVIIMAGGKGTRMKPFTNILPKPLIPIGERSMLEVIMDEYKKYGINDFTLSLNYKAGLIKAYIDEIDHDYNISYIKEEKFLGTAGALKLFRPRTKNTSVFVSNCDILISENYHNILNFHKSGNFNLTLVAAVIHHQVPYGVCKIKNGGELDSLSEKPEYDYLVNSGMYIVESSALELIPENEFFHITHLMEKIKSNGGKIGVYPVTEKSWIDVGQWGEYQGTLKTLLNG